MDPTTHLVKLMISETCSIETSHSMSWDHGERGSSTAGTLTWKCINFRRSSCSMDYPSDLDHWKSSIERESGHVMTARIAFSRPDAPLKVSRGKATNGEAIVVHLRTYGEIRAIFVKRVKVSAFLGSNR